MPDGLRPAAKAVVAFLLCAVGIFVAIGVLDVEVGKKITAELIALAIALGLVTGAGTYATRNTPR